jgi:hypothetical protein
MIDVLRHDQMGEQPGRGHPPRDRLGRKRGSGHLRVVAGAFADATSVGEPHHLPDEQGGGSVVEPLGHVGPNPNPDALAVRARLLGLGQVYLDALAGQVVRQRATTVPPPPGRIGLWRRVRHRERLGSRGWLRIGDILAPCRLRDPLGSAAERHPHEVVNTCLLLFDSSSEFGHRREEFLVHPPQVRGLGPKGGEFHVRGRCGCHTPATRHPATGFSCQTEIPRRSPRGRSFVPRPPLRRPEFDAAEDHG